MKKPDTNIEFVDTHCHSYDTEFIKQFKSDSSPEKIIEEAQVAGVKNIICVGTNSRDSKAAVDFCNNRDGCYATVALHPHEAANNDLTALKSGVEALDGLIKAAKKPVVAVGECGLDYYYHDDKTAIDKQQQLLRWHLELAQKYNLPLVFHVRDAFDDFLGILADYPEARGVVHSFSATGKELQAVLKRGLYVGLNGIMTFSKVPEQLSAAREVPLDRLLIETDAPFLTPHPLRGKMNEPKYVINITQFLCELRGESLELLAEATSANARELFTLR